jgi:RNA polymerase sigma factor (TIGR02999 family)
MSESYSRQVTRILLALADGDHGAAERLFPLVYDQLRALAAQQFRRERAGHTLQPTALVNQAYLALVGNEQITFRARTHFFATAAKVMRQLLVDHARSRMRGKRGGGRVRVPLREDQITVEREEDILAVEEALAALEQVDARQAEIVELRFYGGLTVEEVAEALGVSKRTVEAEWTMIRAWLRKALSGDGS